MIIKWLFVKFLSPYRHCILVPGHHFLVALVSCSNSPENLFSSLVQDGVKGEVLVGRYGGRLNAMQNWLSYPSRSV